jgi:transcriptional regulator with XRE-family HTH domain
MNPLAPGLVMRFKDRLRELRKAAGLSQKELAGKAGMAVGSVRNLEQGQRSPSWPAVVMLARALGLTSEVFDDCDDAQELPRRPKAPEPPGPPAKPRRPGRKPD